MEIQQLSPKDLIQIAKKNHQNYKLSTEAQSIHQKDFVITNLSLKKDPENQFDRLNFRRGLSYIQQIIDMKETPHEVLRKGLRKYRDLMPQWLDIKETHYSTSKFFQQEKKRVMSKINKSQYQNFRIYVSEKANGQNAQISARGDFWVIGSKNKTLLMKNLEDEKQLRFKHQHRLTLLIAKHWFEQISKLTEQQVKQLKQQLQNKTLVGQNCDCADTEHVVFYQKPKLCFYAVVDNNDNYNECIPPFTAFQLFKKYNLETVSLQIIDNIKSDNSVLEHLKKITVKINQQTINQSGQGKVLYISGISEQKQECLVILKLKTLQYRVYRKLRQKLKQYFQKITKSSYSKILKKLNEEIQELLSGFNTKEAQKYHALAKKAFELCQEPNKAVARFITIRFATFISLLQKSITKEQFMEIAEADKKGSIQLTNQIQKFPTNQKQFDHPIKQQKAVGNQQQVHLIVLIPLTIPCSGKSTICSKIMKQHPKYEISIISSDSIKEEVMAQMMKKQKNLSKKEAFNKCGKKANDIFYKTLSQMVKSTSKANNNAVILVDKNHPENALAKTIETLKNSKPNNVELKIIGLFPRHEKQIIEKPGKYFFPFSYQYVLTCLKRVISRQQHETLQGDQEERAKIVIGFVNLFRNFSKTQYNLGKYFDGTTEFIFNNDDYQWPVETKNTLLKILLGTKPGKFEDHSQIGNLVAMIKATKYQQLPLEQSVKFAAGEIDALFNKKQLWQKNIEKLQNPDQ